MSDGWPRKVWLVMDPELARRVDEIAGLLPIAMQVRKLVDTIDDQQHALDRYAEILAREPHTL